MKPDRYDPIAAALKEDIGQGDITTDFFVPETLRTTGRIIAQWDFAANGAQTAGGLHLESAYPGAPLRYAITSNACITWAYKCCGR